MQGDYIRRSRAALLQFTGCAGKRVPDRRAEQVNVNPLHSWTLDPSQAAQVQAALREKLELTWDGRAVNTVGGVDASVRNERVRAAIVVLSFPGLKVLETTAASAPLAFPYVPGLLSFREGPAILAAWRQLRQRPDLALFDGQGIAHPRGLGIAAHMGLWLDCPTIGVAKSRLYGRHQPVGPQRGDSAALYSHDTPPRLIGAVLRTRPRSNPLYVSPGHAMDVRHAVEFVLACLTHYRLPEPTRQAHLHAGAWAPSA
jgi:deoxyribonuclease V